MAPEGDDRLARYLRQQVELGGAEVVLGGAAARGDGSAARGDGSAARRLDGSLNEGLDAEGDAGSPKEHASPASSAPSPTLSEPPRRRAAEPPPSPPRRPAAEPPKNWRKDLPPIPGPGLVVRPPEVVLLGDPISECESLEAVAGLIAGCRKCVLCQERTNTVPGEGNPRATLMCVGEGPGANEDAQGRPFVGAAGKLLDQILAAIECPRETVFIANIVKCRPPQNRKPLPDEAAACLPYLHRQIALIRPKVLLAMGGTAAEYLLGVKQTLGALRGQVHRYGEIPLIVTYHPAALLRNPNWKKPTWEDVRVARQLLEA